MHVSTSLVALSHNKLSGHTRESHSAEKDSWVCRGAFPEMVQTRQSRSPVGKTMKERVNNTTVGLG